MLILGGRHPTAGAAMAKCLSLVLVNNKKGTWGRKVYKMRTLDLHVEDK